MAEVNLSMEEWHNVVKSLNKLLHLLCDTLKERDSFRKQRDELINDMQNVKRKAQAFDEILEIAEEDCWAEEFAAYVSQIIDNYKEEQ